MKWAQRVIGSIMVWQIAMVSQAAVPQTIAFQGQLTDANGTPTVGSVTVTFRLYDALTAGTKLWEETQSVSADQGLFSALLGSITPLTIAFDQPYWVELQVNSEVLSPRQPLSSSPYALRAKTVEGVATTATGSVGIGTTVPAEKLEVVGNVKAAQFIGDGSRLTGLPTGGTGSSAWTLAGTALSYTSGPVGIGTSDPSESGRVASKFTIRQTDGLTGLAIMNQAGSQRFALNVNGDGSWTMYDGAAGGWNVGVTQQRGNVGIGTGNPTQKLEVSGAVRLTPTGAPGSPSAGTVYFDTTSKHFFGFDGATWKQLDN